MHLSCHLQGPHWWIPLSSAGILWAPRTGMAVAISGTLARATLATGRTSTAGAHFKYDLNNYLNTAGTKYRNVQVCRHSVRFSCAHQACMRLKMQHHSMCLQHRAGVGWSLSRSAWLAASLGAPPTACSTAEIKLLSHVLGAGHREPGSVPPVCQSVHRSACDCELHASGLPHRRPAQQRLHLRLHQLLQQPLPSRVPEGT